MKQQHQIIEEGAATETLKNLLSPLEKEKQCKLHLL